MSRKYKLRNSLGTGDILIHSILWGVMILLTFGLLAPFFAYYFVRKVINTTSIVEVEA